MPKCQVCGCGSVAVKGNSARCLCCGALYDVIRHGKPRDFSSSPAVSMQAALIPTETGLYIFTPASFGTSSPVNLANTTQPVGTKILISITLYDLVNGVPTNPLDGKSVNVYYKVNGSYALLRTVVIDSTADNGVPSHGGANIYYTLSQAGTYSFYADFPGDSTYAGCTKAVHGLTIQSRNRHYSSSPTIEIVAGQAPPALTVTPGQLTVTVLDKLTRLPIQGATVTAGPNTAINAITDSTGTAVFQNLAPGTYTIGVSASGYFSGSSTIIYTSAGASVEVDLLSKMIVTAAGIVAAVSVAIAAVGTIAMRRRG